MEKTASGRSDATGVGIDVHSNGDDLPTDCRDDLDVNSGDFALKEGHLTPSGEKLEFSAEFKLGILQSTGVQLVQHLFLLITWHWIWYKEVKNTYKHSERLLEVAPERIQEVLF